MDHLEERFPLAYNDLFKRYTRGRRSRKAMRWRLPVRRAPGTESEITGRGQRPDADYAGHGTHTVKMFSIPGYSSPGQLLDRKRTSTLAPVTCNMFISSLE